MGGVGSMKAGEIKSEEMKDRNGGRAERHVVNVNL